MKFAAVMKTTDFLNKKVPKAGSNHNCLVVINVHSAHEKDENIICERF